MLTAAETLSPNTLERLQPNHRHGEAAGQHRASSTVLSLPACPNGLGLSDRCSNIGASLRVRLVVKPEQLQAYNRLYYRHRQATELGVGVLESVRSTMDAGAEAGITSLGPRRPGLAYYKRQQVHAPRQRPGYIRVCILNMSLRA